MQPEQTEGMEMNPKDFSVTAGSSGSNRRHSDGQKTGVEHLKADLGVPCAQGTARPLAFELAEHVPPLRNGQAAPFHLSAPRLRRPDPWKPGEPANDPSLALKGTLSPSKLIFTHKSGCWIPYD